MKNYERIELTLESLSDSDVIRTSAEVTTDKITIQWNEAETNTQNYNI